jgi:hypothetical protein
MNPYYEHFKSFAGSGAVPAEQLGDVYRSVMYQRGFGIGNDFGYGGVQGLGFVDGVMRLFKLAVPALKTGLQYLGKQAVTAAADVATDAIMGKNVQASAAEHFSNAARDVIAQAPALIQNKKQGLKRGARSAAADVSSKRPRATKKRRFGRGLEDIYPGLEYF